MQKIPMAKPAVDDEMVEAAVHALRNERMVMGESVFKFEEEFARYIGVKHAISVSSGTEALHLSMIAIGVQKGTVITTPFSFIATANSVVQAGGRPVFADILQNDFNLDPVKVMKTARKDLRAIMPVHIFGHPADLKPMLESAEDAGAKLVEDAAQAHGALYRGSRVGGIGHVGCFSFYPTKNMTVAGDGGMVTTNDDGIAKEVAKLRDCGRVSRYVHDVVGFTARLNTVNAAIGRVQLSHLENWNERRRRVAALYERNLKGVEGLTLPPLGDKDVVPVFHLYVIRTNKRDALAEHLGKAGVDTAVHYPVPIHLQPVYKEMYGFSEGMYPLCERVAQEVLSLPIHPALSDEEVSRICDEILGFFRK
ncbi:MAG TPA: DegT/DnrJ/EryC1/StrS family aminotransferase [Methanomassiliicoccales archaeon]|nr:DegT/DnrJ/EryC1/StrS family aminotransferase [Methanomassiliicoccales archaeon]